MRWPPALAVAGALRPSELLGSRDYPERRLRADQLKFFTADERPLPIACATGTAPTHCELTLDISKTDQQRRGLTRVIGAECAVSALWQWCRTRGATGRATLFQHHGTDLTLDALLAVLRRKLELIGYGHLRITGKCFRKGGASTLAECGVPAADIAALAWADGSTTWANNYANHTDVKRARKLHISRQMQQAAGARPASAPSIRN